MLTRRFKGESGVAALCAAIAIAVVPSAASATAPQPRQVPDQLLVKASEGASKTGLSRALAESGAHQVDSIPGTGVRVVHVAADRRAQALERLQASPAVAFAEPDGLAQAQEFVPDDPYFPQGTHSISAGAWGWYRSHTTQAWDVTDGDPGVVVAILDTGLKTQGLDFDGQVVSPHNVLDGSSNVSSASDNHGTYVAGAAGLAANTGSGGAGYCPGCRLMPVQIASGSTAAWSDMATGVTWAADHGARIINLSWAGTASSSTLQSAVSYARSKGAVVFAAAGNSNCNCPTYPASTPGVLGVGGVGQTGAKSGESNYGSWVALAAPTGNMTAWPTLNGAPGYGPVGGTSLASPAAAGIAGLVLSARPSLSGAQLESALTSSARPASFAVRYGEVDAMAALASLGISDPQPVAAPANGISPQVLRQTNGDRNTASLTAAPQVGDVLVRGQGSWTGSSPLNLSAVKWSRCSADGSGCTVVGSSWKYTVGSADAGSVLKLAVTFANPQGSTTATAPLTAPVGGSAAPPPPPPAGTAPASTAAPVITGTAQAGSTLTVSNGSWSGSPTSYAYSWQRCDASGSGCNTISGATGQSLQLGSADVGSTVRAVVSALNQYGSASATSAASEPVAAAAAATVTTTFTGGLTAKAPSKAFDLAMGSGDATATLTFSKVPSMGLALNASDGSALGSATGASGLQLARTVNAGTNRYIVSGASKKGSASFTLTVTSPAP